MGQRYGAFTLIIIGEGFISVIRAFNLAISGFSITSAVTYPQVILAISIMYLLFTFLFTHFDPKIKIGTRCALVWEAIHFPMHFNLLLLLAALVVSMSSYIRTIEAITNGTDITLLEQHNVARYFDQLYLEPDYNTEMSLLRNLSTVDIPVEDPTILAYQYLGQIMFQVTNNYGIELEDSMVRNLENLYALNTTWSTDESARTTMQSEAYLLLRDIIQEPATSSLSGILWLFPTAGIALIFCAIRSMLWHRYKGICHSIIHGIWVLLGLVLCSLGLLDIGKKDFDIFASSVEAELSGINPMYWLIHTRTPLLIVVAVYLFAYIATLM
ncbi:uncharacterized protein IL334_000333 [Kwoniella shivajii]|uniref:Uncharacterized protein n=1 Tax=Kwoniella shivajii TaxID=564305 RepID=A0ABZ1CNV7_9TREE|nr:hypothetical protein IL334_000333 [Kwoniella shivajii]